MHPELKGLPPRALNCYFQSESESPARGFVFFFQVYLTLELLCTE